MDDQIVDDEGGGFDDAPVEVEVILGGARGPTDPHIGYEDLIESDIQRFGKVLHLGW